MESLERLIEKTYHKKEFSMVADYGATQLLCLKGGIDGRTILYHL
jgi:hypothetical protein